MIEVVSREMPSMSNNAKRLKLMEFIKTHGIVFKHVQLFSKVETDYYYDLRKISLNPYGIDLIADLLLDEVRKFRANSVGGLAAGAIPLATAVMIKDSRFGEYQNGLRQFFVRKEPKKHGLQKKIEGEVVAPVAIVDDVLTSGRSVMEAIEAVRDQGNTVTGVVCIIDREEKGTPNLLKENNIKYSSLFKHSDFKSFIDNKLKERQLTQGNTDNQF